MEKYEVIAKLAKSIEGKEPEIWRDDDDFDALNAGFDYTQDVFGTWDDTFEFIKNCNGMSVVAWAWKDNYPSLDNIGTELPKLINGEGEHVYHKGTYNVWKWETSYQGYDCNVLKFRTNENTGGTDYYLFWYLVAFEIA